jgi:hypothetical protein
MSKRLLLLACLLNSLLYAQPATIAGKFPYQRDVSYTAMLVSNQITFIEEWGKVAGTSDTSGHFHFLMDLTQPSIIQFGQRDKIELYLRPGDSLWVEMINARNISFGGSAARENTLLAQLEKRPFIPHEILESPSAFSQLVDTLYNEQMQRLAIYEADHPDPGFVSLYLAKVYERYLSDKIKVYNALSAEGLEGDLLDRVRRQIRVVSLVDETRSAMYINSLNDLFSMETLQIMGQDVPNDGNLDAYPEGYTEVFQGHLKERLARYPKLQQYFELLNLARTVQHIQNLDRLTEAAASLERISQAKDYAPLAKLMQLEYRKKEIQYKLVKLPESTWKTPSNQDFQLLPSPGQRTLVVFWDVNAPGNAEALQEFQLPEELQAIQNVQPTLSKVYRDSLRFIWVQLGGSIEVWQRTIAEVSNSYAVQHCYLNDPAAMAALKPYFFQAELPMAFKLDGDLKITGMSKHPNPSMDWLFERMVVGGRVIWRGRE